MFGSNGVLVSIRYASKLVMLILQKDLLTLICVNVCFSCKHLKGGLSLKRNRTYMHLYFLGTK